ncbi:M23 family metallopeptidase [Streptomyces sp. H27-C3]|uniref:M23 family metallopeptidase n=1 Tax=Streptomyces sp. H27-C3 TaxID=3046305 RepID=UPI0024B8E52B|nr:M23 family metallopeptidase [Streptomyces sp. H27-C3]MDJ0464025.1 M23 family metallopeptidase [Streptomyces sp. H27-C3]
MDDQHAHAGYDGYSTGSFDTDPLFGTLPGPGSPYGVDKSGQYDSSEWDTTGAHQAVGYDTYGAQQHQQHQQYETTSWPAAGYQTAADIPAQTTGQWDANAWNQAGQLGTEKLDTGQFIPGQCDSGQTGQYAAPQFAQAADATGQWSTASGYNNGAYDTGAWNVGVHTGAHPVAAPEEVLYATAQFSVADLAEAPQAFTTPEAPEAPTPYEAYDPYEPYERYEVSPDYRQYDADTDVAPSTGTNDIGIDSTDVAPSPAPDPDHEPVAATAAVGPRRSASRGRRRTPARRSALLTVAVPSACVMGVAGIAAASVGGVGSSEEPKDGTTTVAAPDAGSVKPVTVNNKLDTQLANLSADADDFADRASRTQERIDLKARQIAEKKRRVAEAARKEAERPKFVLPVAQQGLSAYYGQAGVNWMSQHSGIDFPVGYGTPVMAATDGTVRTQYNSAYGNMAIVTAADGTETWYCHLSTNKLRSGSVQAGDTIAYSGDSGNSTGPHLHFEVRPGGGAAVDPLSWLRSHNLDPT